VKTDFKNINSSYIRIGSVFFLYGNYKKAFDVFCAFIQDELRKKSIDFNRHFCSVNECADIINNQCDLFGTQIDCFFIRNVEDNHQEKISKFFNLPNVFFVLESGNYGKCKKITDFLLKSNALCIPSFNNELTMHSLCKMFFPKASQSICNEVVKIINNTDEELCSLFKKISLLIDQEDSETALEDLRNYYTYKQSFLSSLEFIPLIRVISQSLIKEKILKTPNFTKINITNKDALHSLLEMELKQKLGYDLSRSCIYGKL